MKKSLLVHDLLIMTSRLKSLQVTDLEFPVIDLSVLNLVLKRRISKCMEYCLELRGEYRKDHNNH